MISARNLALRSAALHAIRSFFHDRDFLEVDTPVRLKTPALELHIDAEPSGDHFLRTSPELHMKRLLASGHERIFQLGPCFRRGERGDRHHPEFTMLEWYRAGADYMDILKDTQELMVHVIRNVECGDLAPPCLARLAAPGHGAGKPAHSITDWKILTVSGAFQRWAGWDPAANFDADRFNQDLVDKVEPALPRDVPVILKDYPAAAAALSRRKASDPRLAERWELYLGGLELANAYSELTDAAEQETRFRECADERRTLGKDVYPIDEAFLAALRSGLPPCGGIAFGVDRLVMLLAGAKSLDEVMAFRE